MELLIDAAGEQDAGKIRKMRWSRGFTQQELADGLNLSLFEVEYLESGYCRVPEETLSAIAQLLGASTHAA